MKEIILFPENKHGKSELDWLKSNFSFSFGNYYNPEKMGFGSLRVLNNDIVKAGTGFGMHHHDNMEIVTIPLSGSLTHRDSLGNEGAILPDEVQSMSAGSGIEHSEMNLGKEDGEFFQIWIETQKYNIKPEYHQKTFSSEERAGKWQLLAGPERDTQGVVINQNAFIYRVSLGDGESIEYKKNIPGNALYIMNINGKFSLEGHTLSYRDAIGLVGYENTSITAHKMSDILLIEVPYQTPYI